MTRTILAALLLSSVAMPALAEDAPAPEPRAKNVILFIGDGMGISTITAARIYDGQKRGETGEENQLSFERFPNVALVKTYNTNAQVPDSAGTATAMHSGQKTRIGVLGIGPEAEKGVCRDALAYPLPLLGRGSEAARPRARDCHHHPHHPRHACQRLFAQRRPRLGERHQHPRRPAR